MYSITDLNNERLSIVCKVSDRESFNKLNEFCPRMYEYYDKTCDYYLTSRGGRGNFNNYKNDRDYYNNPYILIDMVDIDWGGVYECDYSNGVPMVWEDDI
jgi:hypothetical protein